MDVNDDGALGELKKKGAKKKGAKKMQISSQQDTEEEGYMQRKSPTL